MFSSVCLDEPNVEHEVIFLFLHSSHSIFDTQVLWTEKVIFKEKEKSVGEILIYGNYFNSVILLNKDFFLLFFSSHERS